MSTKDGGISAATGWPSEDDLTPVRNLTGVTLGDFKVEKLLGRGGMGEVYLATQLSLSRPVALKVLRPNLAANPTYLGRLRTEATAVAKLNHPNIVHVYTFGCVDQINFIAMEYVQGTNLREYIIKKGALDVPLAFSIMRQTGQAIGAAGEIGLVHRDVKPENILMTKKGRAKVADFGLCRDSESDRVHLTQSGVTMGTPLYMSPEQAQGHAIDHRSDLYSLGVTYYHMLAGVPPFHAETALALALKQVRETPRSMLIHRPELPPELDRLVLKLIAKDPAERYQSATEMLADLARCRDSIQGAATANFTSEPTRFDDPRPAIESNGAPAPAVGSKGSASTPSASALTMVRPAWDALTRLSPRALIATSVACLLLGGLAGWNARDPDIMSVRSTGPALLPALWLDPQWSAVPKQGTAEEQLRYALLQTPSDEWVPAFLAVPGYFSQAHEYSSKAYEQLARIWYRRGDLGALATLKAELSEWNAAIRRDKELVRVLGFALSVKKFEKSLKTEDFDAVVEGMRELARDDVQDMYDPALVEISLEVCSDALAAANRVGTEPILREKLRAFQLQLVRQLYRIEVPKAGRPAGKAFQKKQS